MNPSRKPRIGLLGIMQELYDHTFPEITNIQETYARKVVAELSSHLEVTFPGAARNREDVERYVRMFNQEQYDGIMIVMLTYGPGLRTVRAFRENNLPVLLANIQPEPVVGKDWNMSHLTFNQGVHGAQDTAHALGRNEVPFSVVTDDFRSESFKTYVTDWSRAAMAVQDMKQLRVAIWGQMPGMADILHDPVDFMKTMGPQVDHVSLGEIHRLMESVTELDIEQAMQEDRQNFDIDPKLSRQSHAYACRLQVAIERFLTTQGYGAWSIYFDEIGLDGRFKQIHMLAASNLMAKGYGYAAEGDINQASLMAAGFRIAPNAHFTEMYAMDFERNSSLQSHMGEGNWKIARSDRKPRLIDRPLGIGGLDNPPTVLFQAQPGPATIASMVTLKNNRYRLITSQGEILDTEEMPQLEMPYFHYRPHNGVRTCLDNWLKNGGPHHQVMHLGDTRRRWKIFAELLGMEYVEV